MFKVSDSGDLVNEENYVYQNISVDFSRIHCRFLLI